MKKTSIKKTNQVLSVLLSSCMLLSATTAASATLVTDTTQNEQIQTNLPPEHTPKTWTLTHELGGPFNYVIMPGDSVVYKGETKHSIEKGLYGQDVAWTSVDAGFSIKKYDTTYLKSNLPEIEFTTTECRNYDSIDGENTQKGDMVKTNTGFTNNTGKILRLWCTGSGGIAGYNIWSAENNVVQVAGAGAAFRSGNHVAIEMIVDLMPKSMQKIMEILISIVVVVVIGYLFMQSIGFIQVFVKSGRSTSMLKIPYSWVYGIAIISYFDMIISYFYALFHGVKSEAKEAASSNE